MWMLINPQLLHAGGVGGFDLAIEGLHGSALLSPTKKGSGRVYLGDRLVYIGLKSFYMGKGLINM